MALTLLQMVNRAEGQLGLTQSNAVISSSVQQAQQMLAIANGILEELVGDYEWQRLDKAYYFTTTAAVSGTCNTSAGSTALTGFSSTSGLAVGMVVSGPTIPAYSEIVTVDSATQVTITYPATSATASASCSFAVQDYALPSDLDRLIGDANWDRTNHWPNLGPKSAQEWQWLQGGMISTVPRERYRIYNNYMRFFPAPTSPLNISFEYMSNYTVIATGGTNPTKSLFTVDTDTCVFKDEVMVKGLKYHWRKAKRLDFTAELVEYNDAVSRSRAQDEPSQRMSMTPNQPDIYILPQSVPEGSWNLGQSNN